MSRPLIELCKVCGCSESRACATPDGACYWVEKGLCSGCAAVYYGQNGFHLDPLTQQMMTMDFTVNTLVGDVVCISGAIRHAVRNGFTGPKADIARKLADTIDKAVSQTGQLRFITESARKGTLDIGPAGEPGRIILPHENQEGRNLGNK